jgi:hypothetical protein
LFVPFGSSMRGCHDAATGIIRKVVRRSIVT